MPLLYALGCRNFKPDLLYFRMFGEAIGTEGPIYIYCCESLAPMAKFNYSSPYRVIPLTLNICKLGYYHQQNYVIFVNTK